LVENKPRQGFFEREQFEAVLVQLSDDLKPVAHFAYITGWRIREILALGWAGVDFTARMVRLEPGTTKNREGRMFPFTPELQALMEHQRTRTEAISKETGQIIPHVFHRRGRPIKDFRGAWRSACRAAALPGRIPHDFRRTAVRNLERAGVPRSVAMKMVGHKTEAIYRRYAIVSESDLRAAAEQLHRATTQATPPRMGTIAGTIAPKKAQLAKAATR
jgi:integrase